MGPHTNTGGGPFGICNLVSFRLDENYLNGTNRIEFFVNEFMINDPFTSPILPALANRRAAYGHDGPRCYSLIIVRPIKVHYLLCCVQNITFESPFSSTQLESTPAS
jgi:hypothetical protein